MGRPVLVLSGLTARTRANPPGGWSAAAGLLRVPLQAPVAPADDGGTPSPSGTQQWAFDRGEVIDGGDQGGVVDDTGREASLPPVARTWRPGRLPGPTTRVVVLSLVLLAAGILGSTLLPDREAVTGGLPLAVPILVVGFVLAESWGLRVRVLRQEQTVSLTELPFVVGLAFVRPDVLVLARVAAILVMVVLGRRRTSVKTVFNVSLWVAEAVAAVAVTSLLAADGGSFGPRDWLAVLAGVLAGPAVFSTVATTAAMGLYEGRSSWPEFRTALAQQVLLSLAVAIPSLTLAVAVAAEPDALLLVVPSLGFVLVAYRRYRSLYTRHVALRGLYTFTHDVTGSYAFDPVLRQVLVQVQALLAAPYSEVVLLAGDRGGGMFATVSGDRLVTRPVAPGAVLPAALGGPSAALLRSRRADPELAAWLQERDLLDVVVAPLAGDAGLLGVVLVGVGEGGVRTFGDSDVELLASLADQASVALRHVDLLERLRHSSDHDALTGLGNRALLHREADRQLALVRPGAPGVAVLCLDLNGFKEVNDGFGHAHGDAVLVEVARRLTATAPDSAVLSRLGGDEFAVLVPGLDAAGALALGSAIRRALEESVPVGTDRVAVGASVGVALAAAGDDSVPSSAAMLQRADLAMYVAKSSDHGPRLWDPSLENRGAQRGPLLAELRIAVQERAITLHVQPQIDPRDGRLLSVEALARWSHPVLGEVPPTTFIPVAERGGLMGALTELVLDRALAASAGWTAGGLDVPVAVNVSARDVDNPNLVATVAAALVRHGVAPGMLTLELTETSVMADAERSKEVFRALKDLGVRLSIDDFGTGWSSLAQLQRLTVDELKIDRSFVRDVVGNAGDAAIVRSVLDLGRNLGMSVVAEGVEDARILSWLAAADCERVQGYHVSRPMPPERLLAWYASRPRRGEGWLTLTG